jgi:RNA polymerase sigma-70 factor (ECF subfamily)
MLDGRPDPFQAVYSRYGGPVFRFALHMTGQPHLAEEATQDTFLTLITRPRDYDASRGTLLNWLLGIARNVSRKLLACEPETELLDESVVESTREMHDIVGEFTRRELAEALHQAIACLPPVYREVVILCELQEFDYRDAAAVLKCPIGTVRSRLHRARALLVSKLQARCFA